MADPALEEFARERDRCVDRLRTMPLRRLPDAAPLAHEACRALIALTPADAGRTVPRLADRAAGDQLAVIAADFLTADPEASSIAEAARILTELRRSLP